MNAKSMNVLVQKGKNARKRKICKALKTKEHIVGKVLGVFCISNSYTLANKKIKIT